MPQPSLKKLRDTLDLVNILLKTDKQYVGKLIDALSPARINNLCELYYNIIVNPDTKNIQYPARRKLKKYFMKDKTRMLEITDGVKPIAVRRKHLINQSGKGIFSSILTLAIPLISSLLIK